MNASPFVLAHLYPHSLLDMYVSGSYGIHIGRRLIWQGSEAYFMYQPALMSSPAKSRLNRVSITISQSNTTPVLHHSGPMFRRLVSRSPQIYFSVHGILHVSSGVLATTLMKRQVHHATNHLISMPQRFVQGCICAPFAMVCQSNFYISVDALLRAVSSFVMCVKRRTGE